MDTRARDRRRAAALAALFGLLAGAFEPVRQVAIEPGQVLARLVSYPEGNPFFVYQARLWTLLHQGAAAAFQLGASEIVVSVALGAVIPAALFAGIALWMTAAFSDGAGGRTPWLAAACVPFVGVAISGAGVNYPVLLAGTEHTYGAAGLAMAFLGTGLLANGAWRAGGFVLGLAPAVHASLGSWTLLSVAVSWPWRDATFVGPRRGLLRGAVAGAAAAAASLAVHVVLRPAVSTSATGDQAREYLATFVKLWDPHRGPLVPADPPVMLAAVLALIACARLASRPSAPGERVLLRFVVGAACVGLVAGFASQSGLPLPRAIVQLMPTRFLNVLVLGSIPLAAGWLFAAGAVGMWTFTAIVGALTLASPDLNRGIPRLLASGVGFGAALSVGSKPALRHLLAAAAVLPLLALAALAAGWGFDREIRNWLLAATVFIGLAALAVRARGQDAETAPAGPSVRLSRALATAALVLLAAVTLGGSARRAPERYAGLVASADDEALRALAAAPGPTAVGSDVFLVQWRTRAPVVIDPGALDSFAYVPETGPAFVRVLELLYEADFFHSDGRTLLDGARVEQVWTARGPARWRQIADELGFRYVLVHTGWILQLPEVAHSDAYVLYEVPRAEAILPKP